MNKYRALYKMLDSPEMGVPACDAGRLLVTFDCSFVLGSRRSEDGWLPDPGHERPRGDGPAADGQGRPGDDQTAVGALSLPQTFFYSCKKNCKVFVFLPT